MLVLFLLSVRERAAHLVYSEWLSWTCFPSFFFFWFWGRGVIFDSSNSWSSPTFLVCIHWCPTKALREIERKVISLQGNWGTRKHCDSHNVILTCHNDTNLSGGLLPSFKILWLAASDVSMLLPLCAILFRDAEVQLTRWGNPALAV